MEVSGLRPLPSRYRERRDKYAPGCNDGGGSYHHLVVEEPERLMGSVGREFRFPRQEQSETTNQSSSYDFGWDPGHKPQTPWCKKGISIGPLTLRPK